VAKPLSQRWSTAEGQKLAHEVVARLVKGRALDNLPLERHEGRIDLRGLQVTAPKTGRRITGRLGEQSLTAIELAGILELRGVVLDGLDLSGAQLESLRFFDSKIANSRFNGANCKDWRLWGVEVSNVSFDDAMMRDAVLGAWYEGHGDVYRNVTFVRADLRSIVCDSATLVDCDFSHARIIDVDFGSSSFIRCRFAGEMRDVIFWDHGFDTGKPDPNLMEDVDFSAATLRFVEFRRLDLNRVVLPTSPDHLVIRGYRCVLEQALRELKDDPSKKAIGLRGALGVEFKWASPSREVGIFHRDDLAEYTGGYPEFAVSLLQRLERNCLETVH
jgi:uncharacterized protein YjbI with pentapeptide repeats